VLPIRKIHSDHLLIALTSEPIPDSSKLLQLKRGLQLDSIWIAQLSHQFASSSTTRRFEWQAIKRTIMFELFRRQLTLANYNGHETLHREMTRS
jgi:hypothetical protein